MKLTPRKPRFPADHHPWDAESSTTRYRALRAFHAPQRAHLKQPMPERVVPEQKAQKAA